MQFLANFLNEDWSDRPAGPRIYLGAFGKHPGWNDHFDLGLETESLVAAKRILYEQGIRTEIEAQTWEKLPEADRLPEFDHWFLLEFADVSGTSRGISWRDFLAGFPGRDFRAGSSHGRVAGGKRWGRHARGRHSGRTSHALVRSCMRAWNVRPLRTAQMFI